MNYTLLVMLVIAFLVVLLAISPKSVYPSSSCSTFVDAARWLDSQNLDDITPEVRGELCKVPVYMITQPNLCPSYDWRVLLNKMRCDNSAEGSGTLGTNGVLLRLT